MSLLPTARHGPADGAGAHLALVRFRLGRHHFALPEARVRGLAADTDPRVPDLAELLRIAEIADAGVSRLLTVAATDGGLLQVRVQEPVARLELPAAAIQPIPPLLAARLRLPGLRALALTPAPVALLLVLGDLPAVQTGPQRPP